MCRMQFDMYHKESSKVAGNVKGLRRTCVFEGVVGVGSGFGSRK